MGFVDAPIVGGRAVASAAQGLAHLRRRNAARAAAKGVAPLTEGEARLIVAAYWALAAHYPIAPDGALVQAIVETDAWTFGGQVPASAHNVAGLGAINDGRSYLTFADWSSGIEAQFRHLLAWCNAPGGEGSPRYPLVVAAARVKGYARTWRDLGGRWAVPGVTYGADLEGIWRAMAQEREAAVTPRIAISAGHHNTDGGDAYEIKQTGELAYETIRQLRAAGFDVVSLTGDDGRAMEPIGLQAVARKVNSLRPLPALFLELHTEGGGGTGVFGIYPDMAGDTDTDVRDRLAPLMSRKVAARTGLGVRAPGWLDPRRGPGVMSERETGVGAAGDRLGIFFATAPVRADVTRMILEVGAHDKEPDLTISKQPGFAARAAAGIVDAIREWTGYDNGADTLGGNAGRVPVVQDEATALKAWAEGLVPFEGRGVLKREGVADLREYGGKQEERLALYERIVAHRLAGKNYVMTLEAWDALRNAGKVVIY